MKLFKKKEPQTVEVKGHTLVCPICSNNLFWTRKALLNQGWSTFIGIDWSDRSARVFVCSECTYIFWFRG